MPSDRLDSALARRISGIRPFDEMPVTAQVWREAHDQHHAHRRLHALAAHRPGIVHGLEVIASRGRARTVVIAPGLAIDPEGDAVVLAEPVAFTVDEPRTVYFVLTAARAVDRASAVPLPGGAVDYYREVEGRDVRQTRELPGGPHIELARVYSSGDAARPVREAHDPARPGTDEINPLHRAYAFPLCVVEASVGELPYLPRDRAAAWNPNRAGLLQLVRAARADGFSVAFDGPRDARALARPGGPPPPTLLYAAGAAGFEPFGDAEIEGLGRYLEAGGVLMGETTGGGGGTAGGGFAADFRALAQKLGAGPLRPVDPGHPLLAAHHALPEPPPGGLPPAGAGHLEATDDGAVVLSAGFDYGAAWRGAIARPADAAYGTARERVRAATEMGVNLIAHAAHRLRRRALERWAG